MSNLDSLPNELFDKIFKNLDGITLFRCRIINKYWKRFIDYNDCLWKEICRKEYKHASKIAKRKCGTDMTWQNIYKNLKMWNNISNADLSLRKFYNFTCHEKCNTFEIDYSILALREAKDIILYDMNTLKCFVTIPEKNFLKISNTESVTIIQIKEGILIQRTVKEGQFETEKFFKADNYVLYENVVYFYDNRNLYKIYLRAENLVPELCLKCDYDIKKMCYSNKTVYLFTDCGKIVSINDNNVTVTTISVPDEWIKVLKHICPLDDQNYVCYSRNFLKVQMDTNTHLYIYFVVITALFFYGDVILIGTKSGEILLYRVSDQKPSCKPIYEKLAVLPENKTVLTLDVYERKTGPLIVASTLFEIFLLHVQFYPEEEKSSEGNYGNQVNMYKRLLKLRDRLKDVQSEVPSCV